MATCPSKIKRARSLDGVACNCALDTGISDLLDGGDDDGRACYAEEDARIAISDRRFKSDAEFLAALEYLVSAEVKIHGRIDLCDACDTIVVAVARYFGTPVTFGGEPLARWSDALKLVARG